MAEYPYNGPWQKIRAQILERDGYRCQIADKGCTTKATDVDHIIPWLEGGAPYDPHNLRAACTQCNRSRGSRRMASMARLSIQGQPAAPSRDW